MKILVLHNRYRQPGGEDAVFRAESLLLSKRGHSVIPIALDNDTPAGRKLVGAAELAAGAVWSWPSYTRIAGLCRLHQPDVVHVHNFWMRLSPAVHAACHEMGVPTVQTLHNYRLLCTGASFLRDGKVCEDCIGSHPWRGVVRRCYQGSLVASFAVGAMLALHRARGTWHKDVAAFIALSSDAKAKFIAGGLPADRIFVKPNFVFDPGTPETAPSSSKTCLYVGRLSPEKGVATLIDAWSRGNLRREGRLMIIGDGPERAALERQADRLGLTASQVFFAGQREPREVQRCMQDSRFVVLPSIWQEPFGMTVIEAFAAGRCVVASNLGGPAETVRHERNGLLSNAGDADDLARHISTVLLDDNAADRMGSCAREDYSAQYSEERNYQQLISVYAFVTAHRGTIPPDSMLAHTALSTKE